MKKIVITIALLIVIVIQIPAQNEVEKIVVMGTSYTVTKVFPDEIIGEYTYEGSGKDPKVLLEKDGKGYFQPHGVPPVNILFWIDCDEKGVWRKQVGGTGRYQYTLIIQYQDGATSKNYAKGTYDLMGVTIVPDLNRVVIYGERYKPLKKSESKTN